MKTETHNIEKAALIIYAALLITIIAFNCLKYGYYNPIAS